MRKFMAMLLSIGMVATSYPACAADDTINAATGEPDIADAVVEVDESKDGTIPGKEPVYNLDFTTIKEGAFLDAWNITGVPASGSVSVASVNNETETGSMNVLKLVDSDEKGNVSASLSIPKITGKKTVKLKYRTGAATTFDLMSSNAQGFRLEISSAGDPKIVNQKDNTFSAMLPALRLTQPGTWLDCTIIFNVLKMTADFYVKMDGLSAYVGEVGPNTKIIDNEYVVTTDIPLYNSTMNVFKIGTYKGIGEMSLKYLRVYDGLYPPIDLSDAQGEALEPVKSPLKAPWMTRADTMAAYSSQMENVSGNSSEKVTAKAGRLTPVELDKTPYLPAPGKVEEVLKSLKGKRNKLYYDDEDWARFRKNCETEKGKNFLSILLEKADQLLVTDKTTIDHEADARPLGENVKLLAFTYKLTGDEKYFGGALDWAIYTCKVPAWEHTNDELGSGSCLQGLGVFYDWCYDKISSSDRKLLKDTMRTRGMDMYRASSAFGGGRSWSDSYMNNHIWVNLRGLMTAGIAISDDYDVSDWVEFSIGEFATSLALFGDDGSSIEGLGYWTYGLMELLWYGDLVRDLFNIDIYKHEWFKNGAYYRIYGSLPTDVWTKSGPRTVHFGDANGKDYYGPVGFLRKFFLEYGIPEALWLSDYALEREINLSSEIENIIWYDPEKEAEIGSKHIRNLPTARHFEDNGFIFARSHWEGDESYLAFKCGPPLGKHAAERSLTLKDWNSGMGHAHPDANHFTLTAYGRNLIIDDGYYVAWTGDHNTLLVDGKGQLGEGVAWMGNNREPELADAYPRITKTDFSDEYDYFVGNATQAYSESSGLKQFMRHMIYLKELETLLVVDDIRVDEEKPLELRFFPGPTNLKEVVENEFMATTETCVMYMKNLTPKDVASEAENVTVMNDRYDVNKTRKQIALTMKTNKKKHWVNAASIAWAPTGSMPNAVNLTEEDGKYLFEVGNKMVTLELNNLKVTVEDTAIEKQKSADLSAIIIDGEVIEGFRSNKTEYSFDPGKSGVRVRNAVSVIPVPVSGSAKVDVSIPQFADGTVVITSTSGDGSKTRVYKIKLEGKAYDLKRVDIVSANSPHTINNAPELSWDNDFASYWTSSGEGTYIDYDLGSEYPVMGIDIAWYRGAFRAQKFDVLASKDGINYEMISSYESGGVLTDAEFYEFPEITNARYIRLLNQGNTEGFWFSPAEVGVYLNNAIKVKLNGEYLSFETNPVFDNSRVLVPMRAIYEALDATVDWHADTRTITAKNGDKTVKLSIGSNVMYIDGNAVTLDVTPRLEGDRTLVPVRAISEAFNAKVNWIDESKTVEIIR